MRVGYEFLDGGANYFFKCQTLVKKCLECYFVPTGGFGYFEGKYSVIKLSVSIFGQTTGYRIYTVRRERIRLPRFQESNIQCLVFNKYKYAVIQALLKT